MRYVVVGGLATEEVSGELLICDGSGTAIHRLSGEARRYFERVAQGYGELPDDYLTAALLAAKVIAPVVADAQGGVVAEPSASQTHADSVSRRRVMALGAAAAAAAGVVTVGLPSAAAAQSPEPPAPAPSFPNAPSGGTNPVAEGSDTTISVNNGTDQVNVSWTNGSDPVTFNWRLYSPGAAVGGVPVSGNLIASSTEPANGWLGVLPFANNGITVPGVSPPQTIMWLLVAPNGDTRIVTSSFSVD